MSTYRKCRACDGLGTVDVTAEDYGFAVAGSTAAWVGDDRPGAEDCFDCGGTGRIRRSVEVRPYGSGQAIFLDGNFISDHYSQDSLAAAHANILRAEGWTS